MKSVKQLFSRLIIDIIDDDDDGNENNYNK
jgi:hypothetical protein